MPRGRPAIDEYAIFPKYSITITHEVLPKDEHITFTLSPNFQGDLPTACGVVANGLGAMLSEMRVSLSTYIKEEKPSKAKKQKMIETYNAHVKIMIKIVEQSLLSLPMN